MSRILIFSTDHEKGTGAFVMLAEFLSALSNSRHSVTVCAPESGIVYQAVQKFGVDFIPLPTARDALLQNLTAYLKIFRDLQAVDVVVAWHTRCFELAFLHGRRLGIPSVGILHDHPDNPLHGALRRKLAEYTAGRMTALIGVSEAVAGVWRDRLPSAKVVCVPNGLADEPPREPRSWTAPLRVGFLGGSAETKGFPLVETWIRKSRNLLLEWHLFGSYTDEHRKPVMALVEFHGFQPREAIYDGLDLLVHTSPFFDPFPTVLLEAARSGIPVIASSLGGSGEIVQHGETGYLFDPEKPETGYQALVDLATDPSHAQGMGEKARRRFLDRFRLDQMVLRYDQVLEDLPAVAGTTPRS